MVGDVELEDVADGAGQDELAGDADQEAVADDSLQADGATQENPRSLAELWEQCLFWPDFGKQWILWEASIWYF